MPEPTPRTGDPTAGLMLHLARAYAGAETQVRLGSTTVAGIYTGLVTLERWPSRTTPQGTCVTLTVYVPDCTCAGIEDYDPDCWRHGVREPEDAEIARLLPPAVDGLGYELGRFSRIAGSREDERIANALAAALREQARPSATPADGSGDDTVAVSTPVDPAVHLREQALIAQGMLDAAELLRCGGYSQADAPAAVEAIEREAARVRGCTTRPAPKITVVDIGARAREMYGPTWEGTGGDGHRFEITMATATAVMAAQATAAEVAAILAWEEGDAAR